MRRTVLLLTLALAVLARAEEKTVPDATPPTLAPESAVGDIDKAQSERIDEVVVFLNGTVKKQFADLKAASTDPAVKALYTPFLAPSLMDLDPRSSARGVRFVKRKGFDLIKRPISYGALKQSGALDETNVWFLIAVSKQNDRPRGPFKPFETEAEKERFRRMHQAFPLLADFWVKDGTLAP